MRWIFDRQNRGQGGGKGSAIRLNRAEQISRRVVILPAMAPAKTNTTDGIGRRDAGKNSITGRDIASFIARLIGSQLRDIRGTREPPGRGCGLVRDRTTVVCSRHLPHDRPQANACDMDTIAQPGLHNGLVRSHGAAQVAFSDTEPGDLVASRRTDAVTAGC